MSDCFTLYSWAVNLEHIKRDLSADPALKYLEVGKSHIEYVWWDDNRNMDRGWIDFTADEQESILGLAAGLAA